jgi:hypothetical protein
MALHPLLGELQEAVPVVEVVVERVLGGSAGENMKKVYIMSLWCGRKKRRWMAGWVLGGL